MNTNEETILNNEGFENEDTVINNESEVVENKSTRGSDAWKFAAGGIPGIIVGAGAVLAADAFASKGKENTPQTAVNTPPRPEIQDKPLEPKEEPVAEEPAKTEEPVAEEPAKTEEPVAEEPAKTEESVAAEPEKTEESVAEEPAKTETPDSEEPASEEIGQGISMPNVAQIDEDLPFSVAFSEAREIVGAGGVFHWRGGLYGTYYADEWAKLTPGEKHDFVAKAQMEARAGEEDPNHYLASQNSNGEPLEEPVAETAQTEVNINITVHQNGQVDVTTDEDVVVAKQEEEVKFFDPNEEGVEYGELISVQDGDGSTLHIGTVKVDGTDVAVIDVDGDGKFDFIAADVNGNGQLDAGEIKGLDHDDATVDEFTAAAEQQAIDNLMEPELDLTANDIFDDAPADDMVEI